MADFISTRQLCLDAAKERVVDCDSTEARFVLVGVGGRVSAEDAERYGLSEEHHAPAAEQADALAADAPMADDQGEKAMSAPPANKAVKGPAAKEDIEKKG